MNDHMTLRHHTTTEPLAVPDDLVSLDAWRHAHGGDAHEWQNDRENWRIDHGLNQVGFADLLRIQNGSDRRAA